MATNTLRNIQTFLATARTGSFSAAARALDVSPSVVMTRIDQLEAEMGTRLFERSTRRLTLTPIGEACRPRYQLLLSELEATIQGAAGLDAGVEGTLRIKAPTAASSAFLGPALAAFAARHRSVHVELVLVDRSVNPIEESFDAAIGALPSGFPNVVEEPLCPYPRLLCAAPSYLARKGTPRHPMELFEHGCLTLYPGNGMTWTFESRQGPLSVEVRSQFSAGDSRILAEAALAGLGIAILPRFLAAERLRTGALVPVLPDFPVEPFWLKILMPRAKARKPALAELVRFLKEHIAVPEEDPLAGAAPPDRSAGPKDVSGRQDIPLPALGV